MTTREDATNTTNTTPKTGPRNPRKLFTDAPPFVHDRPILIGKRPRPPLKFGGNYKLEGAESGSENSTSQQDAQSPPADDGSFSPSPVAKSTTIAETTNWLNTRNRRTMRLEEAWDRTDENNGFRPRTAQGIARTNSAQGQSTTEGRPQAGAFSRARTSQGHLRTNSSSGPERVVREGRIGRSNTYSASPKSVQPFFSSPPTTLAKAYARAEKEEQQTPAPRESESETSSVVGAGSPSPAARDKPRWNTDYESKVSTKKSVEELTGDEVKTHIRQVPKSQESPKLQEDRPRPSARTDSHRERIKKALEAKPMFTKKRAPLDIDRPFAGRKSKAEITPKPAEATREFDTDVDFTSNSLQVSESPMLKIRQQEPSPPIGSPDIGQSPIPEGIIIEKYPLPEDYIPPSSSSKEDSWETLKKLSRLLSPKTSRPPTPEEEGKKETENDPEERIAAEAKLFEAQDKSERNSIHVPSRSRSPSPSPAPAAAAAVPSPVTATSPTLALAPGKDEKIDETPRPIKIDPLSLPTPKVTGAYIETPAASVRRPGKQRSDSPKPASDNYESDDNLASLDNIRRIRSSSSQRSSASRGSSSDRTALETKYPSQHRSSRRGSEDSYNSQSTSSRRASDDDQITKDTSPQRDAIPIEQIQNSPRPLINTAKLNSAAEDVRLLQIQAGLEDTTLDDFDAIIENESTAIPTTDAIASDPIDYLTYDEDGELLTKRERERRLELLFLERMSTRLRNTSSNIRQAKQGIERLESQVSATPVLTPTSADPVSQTITEPPVIHIDIKLQLPQFWTHNEPAAPRGRNGVFWNRNWRFTWIGLILFIFAAWYISELAMCSVFCKPQYASTATWKYSDPLFPWAIPTKTGQWMKAVSRWIMGGLGTSENIPLQAGRFSEDEFL